ncbi:MAG: hypothetical protein QXL15_02725 [Candidatus Korarchaeota archaeon]
MAEPPLVSPMIFLLDGIIAIISVVILAYGIFMILGRYRERRQIVALYALLYVTLFMIDMIIVALQNLLYYYGVIDWGMFIYIQYHRFILLNSGVAFTAIFAMTLFERWKKVVIIISSILFVSGVLTSIANFISGPGGELPAWGKASLGISGMFDIIGYLPFTLLSFLESRVAVSTLGKKGYRVMTVGGLVALLTPLTGMAAMANRVLYYNFFGYLSIMFDAVGNLLMVAGFVMPPWLRKLLKISDTGSK